MNFLVQRGKVRQQAITIPDGLPELLSDITREVLRCQPSNECLCQFIIDYLHSVIVTREKAMVAKSILDRALRQVEELITDMCICDISKEKSNMMAQAMETCFRNFLERRRCEGRRGKETISFDQLNLLEELIAKCQFTDFELEKSRPVIENAYKRFVEAYMAAAEGTDGTEVLFQYFRDRELKRVEELIRHEAATKIQAAFRGYRVRSSLATHVCTCTCLLEEKVEDKDIERMDHAARVIQRFFRSSFLHKEKEVVDDPCEPKSQEDIETTEHKSYDGQEEEGEFPEVDDLTVVEPIEEKAAIISKDASAEVYPEQEVLEIEEQNQPTLSVDQPPEQEPSHQAEEAQQLPTEEVPYEKQLETEIREAPQAEEVPEAIQAEEVPEAIQAEEAPDGEAEN